MLLKWFTGFPKVRNLLVFDTMHSPVAHSNLLAIVAALDFVQNATIGGKNTMHVSIEQRWNLIADISLQFYHVRCHLYVPCAVTSGSKSAIAVPRSVYKRCSKRQLSRYSKLLDTHARLAPAHIPPHQRKRPGLPWSISNAAATQRKALSDPNPQPCMLLLKTVQR
jgi:hypothetical protein